MNMVLCLCIICALLTLRSQPPAQADPPENPIPENPEQLQKEAQ